MSTPYVTFPGTSGNYCSTDDLNKLDADTSHLQQSIGQWAVSAGAGAPTLSTDITAYFGDSVAEQTATGDPAIIQTITPLGTSGIPVSGSTQYSLSAYMASNQSDTEGRVLAQWYDAGGGFVSNSAGSFGALGQNVLTQRTLTVTAPASAAFVSVYLGWQAASGNMSTGDKVYFDAVLIVEGPDTEFVPSLRLVGDLRVEADVAPSDWTPAAETAFAARWTGGGSPPDNRYFTFKLTTAGKLALEVIDSSATYRVFTSTVAVSAADGDKRTVLAELDVSAAEVDFYVDGVQLGTTVSGTITGAALQSPEASQVLEVASRFDGAHNLNGDLYSVDVADGLGSDAPNVARFDAADPAKATL